MLQRSSATTNSGTSTTPSVSLPGSGVSGDLLVVIISHNDGTVTVSDNNGATSLTEDYDSGNDAGGLGLAIYTRVMNGSEPSTLNFTLSTSQRWATTSFILGEWDGTTKYDVAISTYDIRLTTTTHTSNECTTNTANAWAFAIDTLDSGTNTFTAGPGGSWSQIATVNAGQPLSVYRLEKTTPGATGNASFTSASSGNSLAMRQFAIKAASTTYNASVTPLTTQITHPTVTANYTSVLSASVDPLAISSTVTSLTGSYTYIINASVDPLSTTLTMPIVEANYPFIYNADVSPLTISLLTPSVIASGMVTQFPYKFIFVDGKMAMRITGKHYIKI